MGAKRKVCMTGPPGLTVVADALRQAGCELVLGKPLDDFREFRYERKDLVKLIGDAPIVFPAGRDFIGADILDSCPELQAVVKSSIGIETVDVDAATDLGIICCNSPTPEAVAVDHRDRWTATASRFLRRVLKAALRRRQSPLERVTTGPKLNKDQG